MSSRKSVSKFAAKFLLISTSISCFSCYSYAMESGVNEKFQKGMYEYLKSKLSEFLKSKRVTRIINGQDLNALFFVNETFKEEFINYLKEVHDNENKDMDDCENTKDEYYKCSALQYVCNHQRPLRLLKQLMTDIGYKRSMPCSII